MEQDRKRDEVRAVVANLRSRMSSGVKSHESTVAGAPVGRMRMRVGDFEVDADEG